MVKKCPHKKIAFRRVFAYNERIMDGTDVKKLLGKVKDGSISVNEAVKQLKFLPFDDIGYARIDTHRELRKGFPEVVYCRGKTPEQLKNIFSREKFVMGTKATRGMFEAIREAREDAVFFESAGIVFAGRKKRKRGGDLLVISAGTSDIPVAEEAAVTAELMGSRVQRLYDVGVAGVHRLLLNRDKLLSAKVVIVVAGMDGALPSVVGGLVESPVIAVPASVGYGASFKGVSALLTMLNSCAPGVAVVNIDNGFGAGYIGSIINRGR